MDTQSKSKLRASINITLRIYATARLRPGHMRGPYPNGRAGARPGPASIFVGEQAATELPCFVGGTVVYTKEGSKPIEDIRVGDWVLSFPEDQVPPLRLREQHEYEFRRVTQTFVYESKPICEVTVLNLGRNVKESLRVTPDHPFFVKGGGWTPAKELSFGYTLYSTNYSNLVVGKVVVGLERARVYNFEVEGTHTYYVGKTGAWVHNSCGTVFKLPPPETIRSR